MQGIFQKENTDKALKYGIYRHLPTYEKIIRNLVSFYIAKSYINNEGKSTSVNVRKLGTLKELLIKHGPHTLCSTMPDIPYFRSLFSYH